MAIPPDADTIAVLPINWSDDGKEWQVRLAQAFGTSDLNAPRTGWNYQDNFYRCGVSTAGTELGIELCYAPITGGIVVFLLTADGRKPEATAREALVEVVNRSVSTMGQEPVRFGWHAVLGTRDFPWFDRPFNVCGIEVRPATRSLVRWGDSQQFPTLSGHTSEVWCLLQVVGKDPGHEWYTAARSAAQRLGLLASILGVVTGRAVEIRQAPNLLGLPPDSADPPDLDAQVEALNDSSDLGMSDELRGQPVEPPDWLDEAWHRLEVRPWLAAAALTYSEGLLLEDTHPSLAGVAFISAIEAIAYRTFEVSMCSCGQHRDVTARFRAAIDLVAASVDADELSQAYKVRSKVVHQGLLPGMETVRGSSTPSDPYTIDKIQDFQYRQLPQMRRAAQELLRRGLTGLLPPRRATGGSPAR